MVPKLFKSGKSFKKLGGYLLHDPDKAKTADRVLWTHTLNLASDHPALAIDEMLWTYRAADDLKRQAGLRVGGRPLDNPVRHFSLNWHPSEKPTREHMIETVESFLEHMNWQDHQAVIVCHQDKHPHVHVMLNAVHPDTGRVLDSSFERRRAQAWAVEYEREHGLIFCEERLKPNAERTPSPTRATWEKLRAYEKEDDRAEQEREKDFDYFERAGSTNRDAREWDALKSHQKAEREEFFADGKQQYREARNEAYREIRAEFRWEWREFYRDKRIGMDAAQLVARKADILKRQSEALDARRDEACDILREHRDEEYRLILNRQQACRHELHDRQRDGLPSYHLLDRMYPEPWPVRDERFRAEVDPPGPLNAEFQRAAREITEPNTETVAREPREGAPAERIPQNEHFKVKDGTDLAAGGIAALAAIAERLFDGFLGGGEATTPKRSQTPTHREEYDRAAAQRAAETEAANEARAAEEVKVRHWWEDRTRRRHERD